MKKTEKLLFRLHQRKSSYQRKVSGAIRVIKEASVLGRGCVSCSWGKDSVVMLHLVQSVTPTVSIVHVGDIDEDLIGNYGEVAEFYLARYPSPDYRHLSVEMCEQGSRQAILDAGIYDEFQVSYIGLRLEEQGGRRYSLGKYGAIHKYKNHDVYRVCPLLHWSWIDVWAYTIEHNLPYLSLYDHPASGAKQFSRTAPVTAKRLIESRHVAHGGVHHGRIARLRQTSPAYFAKLKARFPHLAAIS